MLIVSLLLLAGCAATPSSPAIKEQQAQSPLAADKLADELKPGPAAQQAPTDAGFPPHIMYQLLVAEVAGQRGQLEVAVANYLAAAKDSRDSQIARRAAQLGYFARALREALEAGLLWVELAPDDVDAHGMVAPLLLAFGRAPEAVVHFQRLIELTADKPDHGLMRIAGQLAGERNQIAAMSVMEQLVATRPRDAYAWLAQGQLALRQNNYKQALASVDQALSLHAHWVPAVILRSRVLVGQDEREAALAFLASERKGKLARDETLGLHYARLLAESGKLEEARREFDLLARQQPRNAEIHYAAGILALQFKDLDDAEQRFKKVLSMRQQRVQEALYYLGRVYEAQGDYRQAIDYYSVVRVTEYAFDARLRIANLLAREGQVDEAIDYLHDVPATDQAQRLRLDLLEAELLRNAGREQEALDFYTEKLASDPDNTALRYARALLAERMDRLQMAEQDLLYIIEREPANAQALNALGYTLADRTERFDEALTYIERALAVEPDDGVIIDSLGWVQYRLGNLAKAEEYLRRAMELIDDPEVAAHLGEVLWEMGNKQAAMEVLRDSLAEHPDHEKLQEIMKRFGL